MRSPRSQLTIAAVAFVLGLLVIVQLRTQNAGSGLEALSAQELTVLVGNLNARNDQLRAEVATLQDEAGGLTTGQATGDTSLRQLRTDLQRVRAWAGLSAVSGPGVRVTVGGPITGAAVEDLLNELRNAGAEAISIDEVRVVAGSVVAGTPGDLSVENERLREPFEVSALGNPETLTGSLTRVGGIVAQLRATFADAELTVTPVDLMVLPATSRDLQPRHGHPVALLP